MSNHKNLEDIYVFVNNMSRESAEEFVSMFDNEEEILKSINIYKKPFHSKRHALDEKIPFVSCE